MKNQWSKNKKGKDTGYTKVPNSFLWNSDLTLEEKSFLIILVSNKEDWQTRITEIYTRSANGDFSQRSIVKSLIQKGYLKKEKRRAGAHGKFEYSYQFSFKGGLNSGQRPDLSMNEFPGEGNPQVENPTVENPQMDDSKVEDPTMANHDLNNTITNKTNSDNTNSNQNKELEISKSNAEIPESTPKEVGFNAPTREEVIAFFEQEGSNAKAALAFFNEFHQRDWFTVKGEKLINWKGMARRTMPKLNAANFELDSVMKTQVNGVAKQVYYSLYSRISKQCGVTGNYSALNFTESSVRSCLYAFCVKHLINDYDSFADKLRAANPDMSSFRTFKEGLGINTNDSGIGRRHI